MDDLGEGLAEDQSESPQDESAESDFDPAQCVLDDAEYSRTYFRGVHEMIDEELEFVLDAQQYDESDENDRTREQNFATAKDMSLLSMARRKWSQIAATPTYINCFGLDAQTDPLAAERTRWVLERETYDPKKLYRVKRRRAIIGAVCGRVWYKVFEWSTKLQEIAYRLKSPRDVLKCPGYHDAHDPMIPWIVLRDEISVDDARQRARDRGMSEEDVQKIVADVGDSENVRGNQPSSRIPGQVNLNKSGAGAPSREKRDSVVLLIGMYREDPEALQMDEPAGPEQDLAPDEQYMRCATCEHETRDHAMDPATGQLPDVGEPCPVCTANGTPPETAPRLQAVRALQPHLLGAKFPDGRWIEVLEKSRTVIYDDAWPYRKPDGTTLSSFPLFEYKIYDDPRYEIPNSDISWQWNQQALATYVLQWGIEQMRTAGRVIFMPYRGVFDDKGRAWKMTNRLDQLAYLKDPMMANAVKEFQPSGLPASWATLYGTLTNNFRSNLGTGELGLGPDQSKDLPVGTVHAIIESGDVPIDDAIGMIRECEGQGLRVVAEMAQCCWDKNRWVRRLGPDGSVGWEYFSGADLTGVNVMITGSPAFDVLQASKLDRMQVWFKMDTAERQTAAQWLNLDPTQVARYEQAKQAQGQGAGFEPSSVAQMITAVASLAKADPAVIAVLGPILQQLFAAAGIGMPNAPKATAGPTKSLSGQPAPGRAGIAPPAHTDLQAPGLSDLSPDLQQGLASMALAK